MNVTDVQPPRKPIVHVVEDDASVRRAIARLLSSAGYDARTYASASELLLADGHDAPGCMLLDVNLPGVNGLDLHAALSGKPDALPVVFLTGRGDIAMGVRAIKAGADSWKDLYFPNVHNLQGS